MNVYLRHFDWTEKKKSLNWFFVFYFFEIRVVFLGNKFLIGWMKWVKDKRTSIIFLSFVKTNTINSVFWSMFFSFSFFCWYILNYFALIRCVSVKHWWLYLKLDFTDGVFITSILCAMFIYRKFSNYSQYFLNIHIGFRNWIFIDYI